MNMFNKLYRYYENIYSKVSHSYIKDTESACSEDNQKSIYEYENSITNCPNLDDDAKFWAVLKDLMKKYEHFNNVSHKSNEFYKILLNKLSTYSEIINRKSIASQKWNSENTGIITMSSTIFGHNSYYIFIE